MIEILETLALVCAALFTGAAFYINFAEHPARMDLDTGAALTQWKPAYKAGFVMQASLAVVSGAAALLAGFSSGLMWSVAGVLMLLNWPYTLFVILPLNTKMMATPPEEAGDETRAQLARWNALHAVRTLLGAAATVTLAVCTLIERGEAVVAK